MSPTTLESPQALPATASTAACLYCRSTDLAPFHTGVSDRLGFVPGHRTFLRCRSCGSAVLDPLPHTDDLPGFYPPVYSFTLELGQSRFKRWLSQAEYRLFFRPQYRAQVRRVMRACGWKRGDGKKLLDVGCGRGLRLLEFRRLGFDVHGLDVQADVVRYLQEELNIPAECADVSAMNRFHAPNSFDLITTFFLIEHIPDVREALAAMFELLKPGGWVAAAVPFVDCVQAGWFGKNWINVREAPRHLSLPTQAGMTEACRAAGFENVAIVPDSALNCAGQIASSLLPGATLTHVYGQSRIKPLLARAVGAGVMFASVPWCLFENRVIGRISLGIAMAQKPVT
ncbi:MAG TPA: class I SAM-dependent methyltransferase [Urbifossiella sp.]|nr:class I SAM-dependent methyltransferase [Urbifossiella sp.]